MTEKFKLISDIRYFASLECYNKRSGGGAGIGNLFPSPFRYFWEIGDRFACKLRELKFCLPGYDHAYLVLTPSLEQHAAQLSNIDINDRTRYINVGASLNHWKLLDENGKHDYVVDLTVSALSKTSAGINENILSDVAALLKVYRSELEINLKTKETSSYRINVSFRIRPHDEPSVAFVTYTDKRSGKSGRLVLTELDLADDIFPLCDRISVKDERIYIFPRKSFRASLTTRKYESPLTIPINDFIPEPISQQ